MPAPHPDPPKLSIITATYKDPDGLSTTLSSLEILQKSGLHWEHVIVDGSPAANEALLSRMAPNWPLKHVKQPPQGIYGAMNRGLQEATGDLVWFLNGGDKLSNIENMQRIVGQFQADSELNLVVAGADLYRNGSYMYSQRPRRELWLGLVGMNRICHQAVVYRKSAFTKTGPFSESYKVAADYDHHVRFYLSGLKMAVLDASIVDYDMSGQSSDYELAFMEFKKVHSECGTSLPLWFRVLNEISWQATRQKVRTLKYFSNSRFSSVLRPLWLSWQRILTQRTRRP